MAQKRSSGKSDAEVGSGTGTEDNVGDSIRIGFADLMIRTKAQKLVVFEPNPVQVRYLDLVAPDWRERLVSPAGGVWDEPAGGRGRREIILKARQFGFSTLLLALCFVDTVNRPNTKTVVIAHDSDSTEGLFRIVRRFYDNLPDSKRPATKYSNRRELLFKGSGSSFSVLTAGTRTSGRSATISNLLCSEVAFWSDPEVLTGLLQAVPLDGNIFQETTANGEGNAYWKAYQAAKLGQSTFTPRFFAWYEHDEYRTCVPAGFECTNVEMELVQQYGLTDEQLVWRRNKIREPGMGSLFQQEYPSNDNEAFLVSGTKFFTEWDPERHLSGQIDVPRHWRMYAGLDWGYGAPFCFLLAALDEAGHMWVIDEIYVARQTNRQQVNLILECLKKWDVAPPKVTIAADPSMWATKSQGDGILRADIDLFVGARLNIKKANNHRRPGWMTIRRYFSEDKISIHADACPNLVRTIPMMVHDKNNVEDLDSTLEDHAVDALRYLVQERPLAADAAAPPDLEKGPRFLVRVREKPRV